MGKLLVAEPFVEAQINDLRNKIIENPALSDTKLLIIRVGNDEASGRYITNKVNMCNKVGIKSHIAHFEEEISENTLIQYIKNVVNKNYSIDGCLIQLPLPPHINENKVLEELSFHKDVDGFSKENLGKLLRCEKSITACTPKGIMDLLEFYNIDISGKDVVIINRSTIVGKPLAFLMLNANATVSICHSKTKNLQKYIDNADILITAVGISGFLNKNNFKNSKCRTIVDVSINVNEDGKICGDIEKKDYDFLIKQGISLTPVPKGVGPCTVITLIKNAMEIKMNKLRKERINE